MELPFFLKEYIETFISISQLDSINRDLANNQNKIALENRWLNLSPSKKTKPKGLINLNKHLLDLISLNQFATSLLSSYQLESVSSKQLLEIKTKAAILLLKIFHDHFNKYQFDINLIVRASQRVKFLHKLNAKNDYWNIDGLTENEFWSCYVKLFLSSDFLNLPLLENILETSEPMLLALLKNNNLKLALSISENIVVMGPNFQRQIKQDLSPYVFLEKMLASLYKSNYLEELKELNVSTILTQPSLEKNFIKLSINYILHLTSKNIAKNNFKEAIKIIDHVTLIFNEQQKTQFRVKENIIELKKALQLLDLVSCSITKPNILSLISKKEINKSLLSYLFSNKTISGVIEFKNSLLLRLQDLARQFNKASFKNDELKHTDLINIYKFANKLLIHLPISNSDLKLLTTSFRLDNYSGKLESSLDAKLEPAEKKSADKKRNRKKNKKNIVPPSTSKIKTKAQAKQERLVEKKRLNQKKLEQQKLEQQKLEQQKLEQQKVEQQKLEQHKFEHQKLEQQKLEQQKLEQQKLEQQKQEQQEQKIEVNSPGNNIPLNHMRLNSTYFFQNKNIIIRQRLPVSLLKLSKQIQSIVEQPLILTGGALNSLYLGSGHINDYDCLACDIELIELKQKLEKLHYKNIKLIGYQYPILRLNLLENDNSITIDISRLEVVSKKIDLNKALKADSLKRDIIGSSMYLPLNIKFENFTILDFSGGMSSLSQGIIDVNPYINNIFEDDPIRLLRVTKEFIEKPYFKVGMVLDWNLKNINQINMWHRYIFHPSKNTLHIKKISTKLCSLFARYKVDILIYNLNKFGILQGLTDLNPTDAVKAASIAKNLCEQNIEPLMAFYLSVTALFCIQQKQTPRPINFFKHRLFRMMYLSKEQSNNIVTLANFYQAGKKFQSIHYPMAQATINVFEQDYRRNLLVQNNFLNIQVIYPINMKMRGFGFNI